jgi:O-antigen/teichoic acid export membrane protein
MFAGWVIDQADRYMLGRMVGLEAVAVYGVGYKFASVVELLVVWPFQLAWPAFSFAISHRPEHRQVYARMLTYMFAVLTLMVLVLCLFARTGLSVLVGARYNGAATVLPLIGIAYALNGIHYCVSPGLHLAGKTRLLPWLASLAAILNVALNFAFIPPFGMVGAAWATVAAFGLVALGTAIVAQWHYPLRYEHDRLGRVAAIGVVGFVATSMAHGGMLAFTGWLGALLVAFPLALGLMGFFDSDERLALARLAGRARSGLRVVVRPAR